MLDVFGACVKGKKFTFENLAKLDNVLSEKPEPQNLFDMAMLFCDAEDRRSQNQLKTDKRIVEWFTRAEAAGNVDASVDAQFMLGWINQNGLCTEEKNKEKLNQIAKAYYTKAMNNKDDEAREELENFDKPKEEYNVTLEENIQKANEGDVDGQFMTGWRYHYGLGVAENLGEAKKYYEMAVAQHQDEDAKEELAKLIAGN